MCITIQIYGLMSWMSYINQMETRELQSQCESGRWPCAAKIKKIMTAIVAI